MLQVFYLLIFINRKTDLVHLSQVIVVALHPRQHTVSLGSQLELLNLLIKGINPRLQEIILFLEFLLIKFGLFLLVYSFLKLKLFKMWLLFQIFKLLGHLLDDIFHLFELFGGSELVRVFCKQVLELLDPLFLSWVLLSLILDLLLKHSQLARISLVALKLKIGLLEGLHIILQVTDILWILDSLFVQFLFVLG